MTGGPCRRIIEEVAEKHRLTAGDIVSDGQSHALIAARHEAMFRCVAETTLSLPALGRIFRRDHTSVGHGVMSHCARAGLTPPRGMNWAHKIKRGGEAA